VPAYQPCASPNSTHGSPLAFSSCSPPSASSGELTLGTPDANGSPANGLAWVLLVARTGDAAVKVVMRDVRKAANLSDYTGAVAVASDIRITDRNNTPSPGGPGPGTVQSWPLHIPVTDCNLNTTVNAVYPGAITAGRRGIWQLGQVQVYDGGADGLASTTGDNTLFLTQGIFIP
jgi:hypothetical protein